MVSFPLTRASCRRLAEEEEEEERRRREDPAVD